MSVQLICADARRIPLPDNSVQMVCTSPPFWGLRKYAGEQELVWGAPLTHPEQWRADCDHEWNLSRVPVIEPVVGAGAHWQHREAHNIGPDEYDITAFRKADRQFNSVGYCARCGAWRGAYGLEPTVEMYIAHTVEILREIRRVLRPDGVCFWNIGDSYASTWSCVRRNQVGAGACDYGDRQIRTGGQLKEKDLCLIPERVALAAQADGWWVRSRIIWGKPNPMPESVTDRPTDAAEHIWLFAKGQWKTSVVKFSDLRGERFHLGKYARFELPSFQPIAVCVQVATALFDFCQLQNNGSLPPFYSEIWKKDTNGGNGAMVADRPKEHWAATLSARFLGADITAEEFMGELNRVIIALADGDNGRIGRVCSQFFPPSAYADSDGTVAVNYSGDVCKLDFVHNRILIAKPTICKYFWDAEAVREGVTGGTHSRGTKLSPPSETTSEEHVQTNGKRSHANWSLYTSEVLSSRNLRNVWTFPTQPYAGAHLATFPEELPRICIKAATSAKGACAQCGAPWERITESETHFESGSGRAMSRDPESWHSSKFDTGKTADHQGQRMQLRTGKYAESQQAESGDYDIRMGPVLESRTVGWRPTCLCCGQHGKTVPCLVLDPFAGSGTTGRVATELNRRALLVDLAYARATPEDVEKKREYDRLARKRISEVQLRLAVV